MEMKAEVKEVAESAGAGAAWKYSLNSEKYKFVSKRHLWSSQDSQVEIKGFIILKRSADSAGAGRLDWL